MSCQLAFSRSIQRSKKTFLDDLNEVLRVRAASLEGLVRLSISGVREQGPKVSCLSDAFKSCSAAGVLVCMCACV